jgi:hypothetical protein
MFRSAVVLPFLLGACTWFSGDSSVLVTSTPAGAEVLVDGQPSGKTTPARLDLGGMLGGDHELTIRKQGYEPETRTVFHHTSTYTSRWIDGAPEPEVWKFPFWWTLGDWFVPFGVRWAYVPHELHVVLYKEGEAPLTADPVAH